MVYHQKRKGIFFEPSEAERNENGPLAGKVSKEEVVSSSLFEEETIPNHCKPYMQKEVNFKLYCDMLMKKTDKQRINIDIIDFTKIKFSNFGMPEIIIRLYSFLA